MTKTKWYQKPIYLMVALALVFSLGVVAVVMVETVEASPGTIHVDVNDPSCVTGTGQPDPYACVYCKIQDAIDDANLGDTINVAVGTYDAFTVEGRNNISIIGQEGVTVNSANMFTDGGEWWVMAYVMNSTNINIEGIVFDGGEIEVSMLEGVTYGDSTGSITGGAVRNIIGSEMTMGVCIWGGEEGSTAVDISQLTVENCAIGIMVSNAETNLDRCFISGMAPNGGYGIMAIDNAQVNVENCEICDCWKEAPQPGEAGIGVMVAIPEDYEAMWGIVDERPSTVNMRGSTVSDNNGGICVYDDGDLTANCNNIAGNDLLGVYNAATEDVDATKNWWGDASGPSDAGPGTGDAVSDNVDFEPWLGAEVKEADTGTDVDAFAQTTNASAQAIGGGTDTTVAVVEYADEPTGVDPGFAVDGTIFVDVQVSGTPPTQLVVEIACLGGDCSGMVMRWFDGTAWQDVAPQVVANGTIQATLNEVDSIPLISELTGSPFAVGSPPPLLPVGGAAYPINKLAILALWIALGAAIIVGASLLVLRRRRA